MTTPPKKKHPNRIPFHGTLTRLDVPSDKPPTGSKGHRVVLTTAAAEAALASLLGMAVSFKEDWDGHDARRKCGVITKAWIEDASVRVRGHIFGRDFPEVSDMMGKPNVRLGMSYELADAHVVDMRAAIWELDDVTFTGAAILLCDKAAYKSTRIQLLTAAAERFNGKMSFRAQGQVKLVRTGPAARSAARCSPAPRRPRG